ncbi:MAG: ABC transporter permease [Candidatus Nanoarchaeia archaeon]|jgi:putative ABC transport system permease protein
MNFKDYLRLTLKNVEFKGLRSWLTILGIVIGIASVVGLMTLGISINEGINSQLESFSSDIITVTAGTETTAVAMQGPRMDRGGFGSQPSNSQLTYEDLQAISSLSLVSAAYPSVTSRFDVEFNDESFSSNVNFIMPEEYEKVNGEVELSDGEMLSSQDYSRAIIGSRVANGMFSENISVGDMIIINGTYEYQVIGILAESGGFGGTDSQIYLNYDDAEMLMNDFSEDYSSIYAKPTDISKFDETTEAIMQILRVTHDKEEGEEDFYIVDMTSMLSSVTEIMSTLTLFLSGIAAISLLVGAISISNTMYTSVYEKTREIGIMKAIGATNKDVEVLFLMESMMISLLGGIGGIVIGLGLSVILISLAPLVLSNISLSYVISLPLIFGSATFSVLIGALSGYFPAKEAAKLDPIAAIWYE